MLVLDTLVVCLLSHLQVVVQLLLHLYEHGLDHLLVRAHLHLGVHLNDTLTLAVLDIAGYGSEAVLQFAV